MGSNELNEFENEKINLELKNDSYKSILIKDLNKINLKKEIETDIERFKTIMEEPKKNKLSLFMDNIKSFLNEIIKYL